MTGHAAVAVTGAPSREEPDPDLGTKRPLPIAASVAVPLGSGLTGFHLVMAGLLPIIAMWHWRRPSRTVLLLLGGYVCAQVLSDLANGTPPESTVAELILFSTFALPALGMPWLAAGDLARWQRLTGLAMGGLAVLGLVYVSTLDARTAWKFGLGAPVLLTVTVGLGVLWAKGRRLVAPVVVALLAFVSFYLGFRSLAAEALVASMLLLGLTFWRPTLRSVTVLFALAVSALFVIQAGYVWAASSGRLGETEQVRHQRQATTEGGILLTSRPELEISRMLVAQRPLLGYGSDPRLSDEEKVEGRDRLRSMKIGFTSYIRERMLGEFQAHSIIFTAWVRAGLLGALSVVGLWAWVVSRSLRLVLADTLDPRLLPFLVCAIPTLTWEFLFSPLSVGAGVIYGLAAAAVLMDSATAAARSQADGT